MNSKRKSFIFKGYDTDLKQGWADFRYEIKLPNETLLFSERLTFSPNHVVPSVANEKTLAPILDSLLLMLGISYWKLYCPETIIIEPFTLSKKQAEFWNTVYTKGLGEFYFKNKIDFRKLVDFPYSKNFAGHRKSSLHKLRYGKVEEREYQNFSQEFGKARIAKTLLLYGGGKDSLVSAELLKAAGKPFSIYTMNEYPFQRKAMETIKADYISIKRELDARLINIAKHKDIYEGHVPVSLMYAFTAAFASTLYGYDYIVASNEETASYGNTTYLGMEINHQWSKSLECEQLVQAYIHDFINPHLTYFSLLRPLKEIAITELFSHYPQYFRLFVSCNKNFTIGDHGEKFSWCGKCPKCLFVFALMAAFIPRKELIEIFGRNLFADSSLITLYKELLGLENTKPFECIGIPEETQVAFYRAYKKAEYRGDAIMQMFVNEFSKRFNDIALLEENQIGQPVAHLIPKSFQPVISCYAGKTY